VIWSEAVDEVLSRLEKKDWTVDRWFLALALREFLDLIVEATSLGETVKLKGFGEFRPSIRTSAAEAFKGRRYINVYLRQSKNWKKRCHLEKDMEKYGVELDKNSEHVKKASERGKCPICGAELSGNPPLCPNCGSRPLEKEPKNE
jgi:nucleoid DNA-binding protein